jgi:hypothetical protein
LTTCQLNQQGISPEERAKLHKLCTCLERSQFCIFSSKSCKSHSVLTKKLKKIDKKVESEIWSNPDICIAQVLLMKVAESLRNKGT